MSAPINSHSNSSQPIQTNTPAQPVNSVEPSALSTTSSSLEIQQQVNIQASQNQSIADNGKRRELNNLSGGKKI